MIELLLTYKYLILFPLAIIEGPIITVIAGLFVRTGVLNIYTVYAIVVVGDALGDSLAYSIGRYGGPLVLERFNKFFKITPEKVAKAQEYFNTHRHKALIFSKIIHGVGVAGLLTAGHLKIDYRKFFFTCLGVSLVQSAFFLAIGILFGHAYVKIGQYIDFFSTGTIVVGIVLAIALFTYFRYKRK